MTITMAPQRKTPWHLWMIGVVTLLWNAAGAYTIMMAQAGRLPDLEPGEAAYYAAQPPWFVVLTDVSLVAATAAAVALLSCKRMAVWLFALSLVAIVVTNGYELAAGTSRTLASGAALTVMAIIALIAVFEGAYARAMRRRAILR